MSQTAIQESINSSDQQEEGQQNSEGKPLALLLIGAEFLVQPKYRSQPIDPAKPKSKSSTGNGTGRIAFMPVTISAWRASRITPAHCFLNQFDEPTNGRKIRDADRPKSWGREALVAPRNEDYQHHMNDRQRGDSHPKPRLPSLVPERPDAADH